MSTSKIMVSDGLPEAGLARPPAAGEAGPRRATTAAPPATLEGRGSAPATSRCIGR